MTYRTKEKAAIADRRRAIASYYLMRVEQPDIARLLKISQSTVSRDINFMLKSWKKEAEVTISETIARELAELNLLEMEAANFFNRAKGKKAKYEGDPDEILPDKKELNRWFLNRLKIKERRARLLGLDQPQKLNVEGGGYSDSPVIFYLPDNGRDPDLIGPGKV